MTSPGRLDVADLVEPDRIHGTIYTDPEVFELELERIFGRTWVYVAHESEVGEPGYYKTTRIGRQPVIVSRGADDGRMPVPRLDVQLDRQAHRRPVPQGLRRGLRLRGAAPAAGRQGPELPGVRLRLPRGGCRRPRDASRERPPVPRPARGLGPRGHRRALGRPAVRLRRQLEDAARERGRQLPRQLRPPVDPKHDVE